ELAIRELRLAARDAGIEHTARVVLERAAGARGPKRRRAGAAGRATFAANERVHHESAAPHFEVQVRELGLAGHADRSQHIAGLDVVAGTDFYATPPHVRVQRRPAVAVIDHYRIAVSVPLDRRRARGAKVDVRYVVANRAHAATRRGKHRHTALERVEVDDADVSARVAVISE